MAYILPESGVAYADACGDRRIGHMSGRQAFDRLTKAFTPKRRARVDARKAELRAATRTDIDIEDAPTADALKASGHKTGKVAVEKASRLLVRTRRQGRLRKLRGKLRWEGSLDEMRRDR